MKWRDVRKAFVSRIVAALLGALVALFGAAPESQGGLGLLADPKLCASR